MIYDAPMEFTDAVEALLDDLRGFMECSHDENQMKLLQRHKQQLIELKSRLGLYLFRMAHKLIIFHFQPTTSSLHACD